MAIAFLPLLTSSLFLFPFCRASETEIRLAVRKSITINIISRTERTDVIPRYSMIPSYVSLFSFSSEKYRGCNDTLFREALDRIIGRIRLKYGAVDSSVSS